MYTVVAALAVVIVSCAHGQNTQNGANLNNMMSILQSLGGRGAQGVQAGSSSTDMLNQGSCGKQQQQAGVGSGELTGVIALLLQNLVNNNQNKPQADPKEQSQIQAMLKMKEMNDLANMVIELLDFKQKEADFADAMAHLCLLVNVTVEFHKRNNTAIYKLTTDAMMADMEAKAKMMTDEEKYDFVIQTMSNSTALYAEIFFRFAAWSCYAGGEYVKALEAKNSDN